MGLARLALLGAFGFAWLALLAGGAHCRDSGACTRGRPRLHRQPGSRAGACLSGRPPSRRAHGAHHPRLVAGRAERLREARRLRRCEPGRSGLSVGLCRGGGARRGTPGAAGGLRRGASAGVGGGPGPAGQRPAGSWQPDPRELAAFVRAAARRFSGFYPDPKSGGDGLTGQGRSLPHVRFWQIWARPNARDALLTSADVVEHYRRMLNAASRALKRVAPDNVVVAGGTAAPGALRFWRRLCSQPRPLRCRRAQSISSSTGRGRRLGQAAGSRPHISAQAHPCSGGQKRNGEAESTQATLADGHRLGDAAAEPRGVSAARQARHLSRAMYLGDRAGAALVGWTGLQDRVTFLPNFPSVASGLFFNRANSLARDAAKPALRAYRFPFLIDGARAWGIAPRRRAVVNVDRRHGRGWRQVRSVDGLALGGVRSPSRRGPWAVPCAPGEGAELALEALDDASGNIRLGFTLPSKLAPTARRPHPARALEPACRRALFDARRRSGDRPR